MRSFLEHRRNRVKLQEAHSAWKEQKRGCLQGSSLGPLLWNVFQNNLSLHRQSANLFTFTDDHQIYTGDILKASQTRTRQTEAVSQWYKVKPTASQSSEIPDPYYRSTSFQENPWI